MSSKEPAWMGVESRRVPPVAIGHRTKRRLEEEYGQELEICSSPRTPLLKTSLQDNAWTCGDNTYGQLGVQPAGEMVTVAKPIQNAVRWASVSTSGHHSVAIGSDGKVYAWGLNSDGQLGRGDTESSFSADPEEVLSMFEMERLGVVAVGAGGSHSVVAAGDLLFVWGSNRYGQLGSTDISTTEITKPMTLRWNETVSVSQITCGANHTMVVTSQSTLYSWGSNSHGQLGIAKGMRSQSRPTRVDALWGIPVTAVAAGANHSLAVTSAGHVFSWGDNSQGQLGHPPTIDEAAEAQRRKTSHVRSRQKRLLNQTFLNNMIEMGIAKETAELALLETGSNSVEVAVEWIYSNAVEDKIAAAQHGERESAGSSSGQVAAATSVPQPCRVVKLKNVISVAAGDEHTLAACKDGVFAFGANAHGQLGIGSTAPASDPQRLWALDSAAITSVAAGSRHSLFLSSSGQCYAAGSASSGQFCAAHDLALPRSSVLPPSPLSATSQRSSASRVQRESAAAHSAVDAATAQAAAKVDALARGDASAHEYSWPVAVRLPLATAPTPGSSVLGSQQPVIHSIAAGGCGSTFLIRAPHEHVEPPPPSLLAKLEKLLDIAEQEVRDGFTSEPLCLERMRLYVTMIFGNATALCAAFSAPTGGMDVQKLDDLSMRILDLYSAAQEGIAGDGVPTRGALASYEEMVVSDMRNALVRLVEDIQTHIKLMGTSERALLLLAAAQNPCLTHHPYAKVCLPKLCTALLSAPPSCQKLLVTWWSMYPGKALEDRVVKPLQSYTTHELQATKKLTLAVMNAIKVLAKVEEANMVHMTLPPEAFYNQLISEKMDMQDHYVAWRQSQDMDSRSANGTGPFSFCSFPFLLDAKAKTRLLQVEAKMQMEQTVAESRLEALYAHYKKNKDGAESELVAPTPKMLIRMEMQKREQDQERDKRERAPSRHSSVRSYFSRLMSRAGGGSRSGEGSSGARPSSASRGGDHPRVGGDRGDPGASTSAGSGTSSPGTPATENERRLAQKISSDAAVKRAASLQLPPPAMCQVAESHPDMCIVRVRRNHLVEDAMDEISRQFKKDLFKPLRVHFIGEEGIDAGGVKKEFFQLLVTELLCPDYGLLKFYSESRAYWFNRWAGECLSDFKLLGLIVGLAIYNFVLLDFPLPIALYRKMCSQHVNLSDLTWFQPTVGKSLRLLLEHEGPGSVEDVFCQTFSIEDEVAGVTELIELVPGGADIPVTEDNRREFVDKYVDWVLVRSVASQYDAFREGFMMLYKGPAITLFSPAEKERLVCGNPHLDFAALKKHAKYEAGYSASTQVIVWMWDIAENVFELTEKRMFLKFFTGSDRSPIGGLGNLKCLIQRDGASSNKLPTSHTCFNTLLLPEYDTHAKLLDRLRLAIMNSEGFGLE